MYETVAHWSSGGQTRFAPLQHWDHYSPGGGPARTARLRRPELDEAPVPLERLPSVPLGRNLGPSLLRERARWQGHPSAALVRASRRGRRFLS